MLGVAVKSAGFPSLLQHVISVHPVRRFKTDPAAYALGPATLGLAAREILFRQQQRLGRHRRHLVSATPRCGSTAPARRPNNWAPSPATPAAACATC
jgi:hypothetical protein